MGQPDARQVALPEDAVVDPDLPEADRPDGEDAVVEQSVRPGERSVRDEARPASLEAPQQECREMQMPEEQRAVSV